MAESLKIEIEVLGGGENAASDAVGIKGIQAKDNAKAFFSVERAVSVAKQFATQIVDGHIGMIGLNTGNYMLQERIQRGIGVSQKLIGIGMSFAINPVLGALNVVSEGINLGIELARQYKEVEWKNRSASELARRAGYLGEQNRGRG